MTAFARSQATTDWGHFSWEIRSVNQRFLEIHFKLPDTLRHLETAIREQLKAALHRGKIEVSLKVQEIHQAPSLQVNPAMLAALSEAVGQVQQSLPEATHINPLELLNWPGILQTVEPTDASLEQRTSDILQALPATIETLNAHRQREGEALADIIRKRCQAIETWVEQAQQLLPEVIASHTEKLRQRMLILVEDADELRLHQEVALLAQKLDVQEELDRLRTHLREIDHVLHAKGAVGRRLDFLMQELNREANTLGSKSVDSRVSQISVELKVLIEQMREQIQNIE
jgi:uncharacterized protein (TIGR00255 family)